MHGARKATDYSSDKIRIYVNGQEISIPEGLTFDQIGEALEKGVAGAQAGVDKIRIYVNGRKVFIPKEPLTYESLVQLVDLESWIPATIVWHNPHEDRKGQLNYGDMLEFVPYDTEFTIQPWVSGKKRGVR